MFEKEAEKHKEHFISVALNLGVNLNTTETIGAQKEESFREGAEFGFNKANEWHNLIENPDDLPDTDRNVWVKRKSELECQIDNYYEDDKGWGIMFREGYCTDDVILWCELPVPPKE